MRARLSTLGVVASVVTGLVFAVSAAPARATIPNDQVIVTVTGALSGMTSSPSFSPAFSPSVHDYAIYCQSGVNVISFTFGGVTPGSATVSLGENQAAMIEAGYQSYWIRCLPHDFPRLQITGSASAVPGWYLTGNVSAATSGTSGLYAMVLDSNGTPVWYQKTSAAAVNVEALPDDTIAWMPFSGPGVGANFSVGYNLYNLDSQTTQVLKAPIGPTDPHEMLPLPNGDYLMLGTPVTQLASPFDGYHAIVDCVVQEVSPQGGLVWSWRASNHVALAEGIHANPATINGQSVLDVYHCNSIELDPTSGQVLLSLRNASALYLVQRLNPSGGLVQNGPIIWKLDGCGNTQVGSDHEPVLRVQGDPEGCFDAQHDARFEPNGRISVYDDHSYQQGGGARGVVYALNASGGTAAWVAQYPPTPNGLNGFATGSFRMYDNGTDNLVGWGIRPGSGFTEMDAAGNPFFSMTFPNGELDYRVVKVPLNALSINAMRATAGLPRPAFPTLRWETLGGVLTSKPAAASPSSNRFDVFARGSDGHLWVRMYNGSTWGNWLPFGGLLYPGTGPAVTSSGPGRVDVFVEGTDRQLWHGWLDGSGWHAWEPLGGTLASGPAAASWGPGRIDVVIEGTDHAVWHKWFTGGSWYPGWESLGSQTTADPAITSWGSGRLDIFTRGPDNQLGHIFYTSDTWSGWESLGGNLTNGPAAVSFGVGLIDVIGVGTGSEPERLSHAAGWQIWQPLGGATSRPPAVVGFQNVDQIFLTGTNNDLYNGALAAP
jgi:hypothetical protein